MDYNSLIAAKGQAGSIANWVNWSDAILPLPDIVADAQSYIFGTGVAAGGVIAPLRCKDMIESGATLALAAGTATAARPADFLGLVGMFDQYQSPLTLTDVKSLLSRRALDSNGAIVQSSQPAFVALGNVGGAASFLFEIAASANITLSYAYYKLPAALSVGSPTNFLTSRYPNLLRAACLFVAADFLNDETRVQKYSAQFAAILNGVNIAEDIALAGMSVPRTYY